MANAEHFEILKSGVEKWNEWREENSGIKPILSKAFLRNANLSGANLSHAYLDEADFYKANLSGANLSHAYLSEADFYKANLSGANLSYTNLYKATLREAHMSRVCLIFAGINYADLHLVDLRDSILSNAILNNSDLSYANLSNANLKNANLREANMNSANLSNANLKNANLRETNMNSANLSEADIRDADMRKVSLVGTNLTNANIADAKIYGISAWDIKKDGLVQKDLVITKEGEPEITVDNLEVAQFIYLLLNNQNIRDVIDTLTSKSVLILGRFSDDRKPLLNAIKDELRNRNYLPILFDFEKPTSRDITETISILARMSRFVIADLTDAKSIPQELSHFVPDTFLPVVPIILKEQQEYSMFEHFRRFDWVLPIYEYATSEAMLSGILENVIEPAERKVEELKKRVK